MFNKKRLFVAGAFLIALLFMTMYAGGSGEQGTTAMRIVKFIDGYNNAEISTQNVEVGKEAIVPDSPTHRNNLFIGWYNDETEITSFKNITENLTVISRYVDDINNNGIADSEEESYTVTFFDTIANENISVVDILTGMDATAPAVPSHDGYTFTGWSRGFTNVASNLTVNALYRTTEELESDDLITHTVRFLVGDEEISTQTIEEGASATAPDAPKIDEKVFTGWDTSFDKVTTDLTVKAVYADDINKNGLDDKTETRYTVTFVAGTGGTLVGKFEFTNLLINLSLEDNGVTIPETKEEDCYKFNGWNVELTDVELTDVELTRETKVAGNTTYTANFKDVEKPTVEIRNVNELNPESFDIYATDLESGLKRMDYSLYTNDNTLYLGGGGQWIDGIVDIFELNNITDYSLEKEIYLLKDLSDGEYTLRVTVSDNEGNTTHATNFNFEVDRTASEEEPSIAKPKLYHVVYTSDLGSAAWNTLTSKTKFATEMTVKFRVITTTEIKNIPAEDMKFVKVYWTNENLTGTQLKNLVIAKHENENYEGFEDITHTRDTKGYYSSTRNNELEGKWNMATLIVDKDGNYSVWSGHTMYFTKVEPEKLTSLVTYSPETPTNIAVAATIKFNAPVTVPVNLEDIWLPVANCHMVKTRMYCKEWKQVYFNNTEEQPEFTTEDGRKSNPVVTIDKIDRNLNRAVVTKNVAADEKSVLVTLTADEEIIVESSGWTQTSTNVWEKTYTENNLFGNVIYRDLAGNYILLEPIIIYEIKRFSWFNTAEPTNEFSTTTDEEQSTSGLSTISEENTLFDETTEEAVIKSDEPEVIETTEENI